MSVKDVHNSETPVQSRVISYRKSSTQAQMMDIGALIKNPKRDKKVFGAFSRKIKKTAGKSAKLAPKSEKWYKAGTFFTQTLYTYTQMIGI